MSARSSQQVVVLAAHAPTEAVTYSSRSAGVAGSTAWTVPVPTEGQCPGQTAGRAGARGTTARGSAACGSGRQAVTRRARACSTTSSSLARVAESPAACACSRARSCSRRSTVAGHVVPV